MEQALLETLLADTALKAIYRDRIKWNVLPQGLTLPALVLHLVSAPQQYTMRGRVKLVDALVQFDCWGGTYLQAVDGRDALIARLDALNDAPFVAAFIENQRDDFTPGDGPRTTRTTDFHRSSLDVRVWRNET